MIDKGLLKEYAAALGLTLDETALNRMDRYADMLRERNEHVNLTAISDPAEMLVKHFVDSLTVLSAVSPAPGASLLDVGTGAGFPGCVLLIARPDLKVTLLDGTRKKLDFISDALNTLNLEADVVHLRAELAAGKAEYREKFDFVTARAVAELSVLCEYCLPFVKIGGCFISMKGQRPDEELKSSVSAVKLLGGKQENIKELTLPDGSERTLIAIKKISQTSAKYPRASAQIARSPLR